MAKLRRPTITPALTVAQISGTNLDLKSQNRDRSLNAAVAKLAAIADVY